MAISSGTLENEWIRTRVVLGVFLLALTFLGGVLWRVQVRRAEEFRDSLDRQSLRRVRLPGQRGAIYDRNGVCLADNRPSYCIAMYVEALRQPGRWDATVSEIDRAIDAIGGRLGLARQVSREDVRSHVLRRLPLPFVAWQDVGDITLARWAESGVRFAGIGLEVQPVRFYPCHRLAAHVLGYCGMRDLAPREEDADFHFYLPEIEGKIGIEKVCDESLSGPAGGELIRVDASGFRHDPIERRDPAAGENIVLTIDFAVQQAAEAALAGQTGAVVVLDCRNGDVLAMASAPTFDPNDFSRRISAAEWRRLMQAEARPLFNRATMGTYPPGSTFKALVAAAAVESGRADASTEFACPGYFDLGDARFRCWKTSGHGTISMRKAIEQSCNAYFCQLGLKIGYDRIREQALGAGLGRKTGIELDSEAEGLVPDNAWKRRVMHEGWRPGDTCNASIGQGALLVTPLQMAMVTAALANGGTVYRPRLRLRGGEPGTVVGRMSFGAAARDVVRGGMRDVVEADTGTGQRARLRGVSMGGKTGTAEHGPRSARRKYGWMIAFAPFDSPRYAVAVVIENAVSGGITVAPRLAHLMGDVLGVEPALAPAPAEAVPVAPGEDVPE